MSLEIGIPFTTTEGALTIFDCDSAARYSNFPIPLVMFYIVLMYSCGDCVETGGTCGWCLYGGFCSGGAVIF